MPDAAVLTPKQRLDALVAPDRRQPEQPELVERNGRYYYTGKGFDATIDHEGTVHIRDRFVRARFGLFSRQNPITGEWSFSFFQFKFDIFAWLDKLLRKNDPFRSERVWFLAGTYDLREELATKAAERKMQETLNGIWNRMDLSLRERKRLTFTLWDDSSDDELGEIGRGQVVAFVREHCPEDGGRGFSAEELSMFNAQRRSARAFAPYAAP